MLEVLAAAVAEFDSGGISLATIGQMRELVAAIRARVTLIDETGTWYLNAEQPERIAA